MTGRSQQPSGTVTFLFTDIEGSTSSWERFPQSMKTALERHDAVLRAAIEGQDGHVFKTVGDAFYAAFDTPEAALLAAVEAGRGLHAVDWSAIDAALPPLKVRMGIHTGAATERDGDYFGQPVNRVARIEAAGNGGQILLSLATQQLGRGKLPPGCKLLALGIHRLKDLQGSESLFQLIDPEVPLVTAAPRTAETLHARDRILVEEDLDASVALTGGLREAFEATLAAVRDEEEARTVTLSSEQLAELARHRATDLTEHRLGRIAEWSQPQYRIDGRFVELTLLIDRGEEAVSGRWVPSEERFEDLRDLIAAVDEPALVLLGPPGAGKSTLLRRCELDTAIDMLRGAEVPLGEEMVTFFVPMSHFKPDAPGQPLPAPADWLADSWRKRFPDLPGLERYLEQGRVLLLLDALNEVPAKDESEYFGIVRLWKDYLQSLAAGTPGNRVVFSCRSLEYGAPLSAPEMRVPQIRIEPMTDAQVRRFLELYSPAHYHEIWSELAGSPQLAVLRSPYFLKLLTDQIQSDGRIPEGRAGLFTGFVRQALRREVERGNPTFEPGRLLQMRDIRRITRWRWKTPWELPDRGVLIPSLVSLAYSLQSDRSESKASLVRVNYDDALDIIDDTQDEDILRAGTALSVLDEDTVNDEILFFHQLIQEYFAARHHALGPDHAPGLIRVAWRADEMVTSLDEALSMIAPADPLPSPPATGWEPTLQLAAAMTEEPDALVEALIEPNLPLAGRCAVQPETRVGPALIGRLRGALLARSRDPEADLRARIDAGHVLGELGDPRLESLSGECLEPQMVAFPAGAHTIGRDDTQDADDGPAHQVELAAFSLSRYPVTNAEWARFIAAGGYADEVNWDTEPAKAWFRGEGTAESLRNTDRYWLEVYREDPLQLEQRHESGLFSDELYAEWRAMLELSAPELDAFLDQRHPGGRITEPSYWHDERFNQPAQPVVGISWFEARAYCAWLAALTGKPYRLPTEPEWEAAARGGTDRRYAFGDRFDRAACNAIETHVRSTTPIGVFPGGDTPEGLSDVTGNVWEWTINVGGRRSLDSIDYAYPYRPDDGREDVHAGSDCTRVARGGSWCYGSQNVALALRYTYFPAGRNYNLGMRLGL